MTTLIALLSTGKGSWAHVSKLSSHFEETILITNDFGKEKYTPTSTTQMIITDLQAPIHVLQDVFLKELRPLVKGTEVALNMVSVAGNEHMALLSALLKLGVGIRLVVATEQGFEEF